MKIILYLLILFLFILFAPWYSIWWWLGLIFSIFVGIIFYILGMCLQNFIPDKYKPENKKPWNVNDIEFTEITEKNKKINEEMHKLIEEQSHSMITDEQWNRLLIKKPRPRKKNNKNKK